jgi:cytidylate kinase
MIVTIDGPAGSGKSTVGRDLARKLGMAYLDTGATYRAVTLKAMRSGADLSDEQSVAEFARKIDLEMIRAADAVRVTLHGEDVTEEIRSSQVTENAHYVANSPAAREVLVELQRRLARGLGDFVAEGRDQGTVVFPHADVKFYLDADPEVRAERRLREMLARGEQVTPEQVLQAILRRDERDRSRDVGPLTKAPDAIQVDTTDKTIEQVVTELFTLVEARR